jgi:hypothetical protein
MKQPKEPIPKREKDSLPQLSFSKPTTNNTRSEIKGSEPVVKNYDTWMSNYLFWLRSAHVLYGNDEPITDYCLGVAVIRLNRFAKSGRPGDRYSTWQSLHTCAHGWRNWIKEARRDPGQDIVTTL